MTRRQKRTAAATLAVAAAVCLYYYFVNPSDGNAPRCLFHSLSGYYCPGCGTQRALHALLHGRISDAWDYNPAAFPAVALAMLYIGIETVPGRMPRIERIVLHPAFILAVAAAVAAWWVIRNI